jgi:hypothetical protein
VRRANSEAVLANLLPATFEPGTSWHVISSGDIDALSYLRHALKGYGHFQFVMLSTWCAARADMDELGEWLDAGLIEHLEFHAGEIFPHREIEAYERALELVAAFGMGLTISRNHAKIILCERDDIALAMEASANVNTNPRVEQCAIHASRELFDHYRGFFSGLRSIVKHQ